MRLALLLFFGFSVCAQTPNGFEAADLHLSAPGTSENGGFLPNGRAEFHAVSLLRLITTAYSLPADRVFGGPSWLETERFDVIAKAGSNAPPAAMRTMLQTLLAERLKLSVKLDDMPQPVYVFMPDKGPQKESAGAGDEDCKFGMEEKL